jgi:hypothetical protein
LNGSCPRAGRPALSGPCGCGAQRSRPPPKPVVGGWLRQCLGSVTARRERMYVAYGAAPVTVVWPQSGTEIVSRYGVRVMLSCIHTHTQARRVIDDSDAA